MLNRWGTDKISLTHHVDVFSKAGIAFNFSVLTRHDQCSFMISFCVAGLILLRRVGVPDIIGLKTIRDGCSGCVMLLQLQVQRHHHPQEFHKRVRHFAVHPSGELVRMSWGDLGSSILQSWSAEVDRQRACMGI